MVLEMRTVHIMKMLELHVQTSILATLTILYFIVVCDVFFNLTNIDTRIYDVLR